jgi:hypothetical protein
LFKVDERVFLPKLILHFLPRDKPTGSADEETQELEGLRLKGEVRLSFAEAARANVQFERAEANSTARSWIHGYKPAPDLIGT